MSVKKRRRNKTIAFRMSEAEKIDLENKVKLSGKKSKQEYIISALLNHKIEAVGNPLMFLQIKRVLERIELMVKDGEGIDEELKNCLFEMLKILESFDVSSEFSEEEE